MLGNENIRNRIIIYEGYMLVSVEKSIDIFVIRSYSTFHVCGCYIGTSKGLMMNYDLIVNLIVVDICAMPIMSATDVVHQAKNKYGID